MDNQDVKVALELIDCASTQKHAYNVSVAKDTIIVAKEQTEGMGRLNRKFLSKEGGCYFSLIIPKKNDDNILHYIPVVSVAIATVLNNYGLKAVIKWPNDIMVNGKKICGILCSSHYDKTIIGMGINIFNDLSEISDIATSFFKEGIINVTRAEVIASVLKNVYALLEYDFEKLNKIYQRFLYIKDKDITVKQNNGAVLKGRVVGISKDGFLKLKNDSGEITVMYGDITVN